LRQTQQTERVKRYGGNFPSPFFFWLPELVPNNEYYVLREPLNDGSVPYLDYDPLLTVD
jgi:hypothetical protein